MRLIAALIAAAALALASLPSPANAHPHVWVNVQAEVVYDGGRIAGLRHHWTFDEMYSTMAIQGLDTNNDGAYSRDELAELTKVNMEGLKEFGYFTVSRLGEKTLAVKDPSEAYLEVDKQGILSLTFLLPYAEPVLAEAEGFTFAVYDASFFIAFELTGEQPVKLAGAPANCKLFVGNPEKDTAELKRLNEAMAGALTAGNANQGTGGGYAKTIAVACPKG
jgi:ABC-type uncharacterized transport system substrate-binding protein